MSDRIEIAHRFRGPPDSGNGGYTCGRLAAYVHADAVQVTLRAPPPLELELKVEHHKDSAVLLAGEERVAEAEAAELSLEAPDPVGLEAAGQGSARSPFRIREDHAFPGCFVCGPDRGADDGLRIFAGPVPGTEVWASPWTPDPSLALEDGLVSPEFVWAALDCPSAAPVANAGSDPPIVLARMTARMAGQVRAGRPHVLQSWVIEREGRKRLAGAALHDEHGAVLGVARALWIELRT